MSAGWEIHPHPSGPWLLRIGGRSLLVPADLGRRLNGPAVDQDRSALLARILDLEAQGPRPAARVWLWLRLPLLPARLVRRLAGRLAPLCGLGLLPVQGVLGLALMIWFLSGGLTALSGQALTTWPLALGLFLLSALWHELGHAAALAREGNLRILDWLDSRAAEIIEELVAELVALHGNALRCGRGCT